MSILSSLSHISWHAIAFSQPHGRAWKILDKNRLISDVIPSYYVCKKYESFARQLNGWGFKRLHQSGPGAYFLFSLPHKTSSLLEKYLTYDIYLSVPDLGCYYHESFLRDMSEITCLIRRLPPNLGKSTPFAEGEPNFYLISQEYPLPPPPRVMSSTTPQQGEEVLIGSIRARAASLDSSLALREPTLSRRLGRSSSVASAASDDIITVIPETVARASTAPEASVMHHQDSGRYYYRPSDQRGYSQHPPYPATNHGTSSYYDGHHYYGYDHVSSQGSLAQPHWSRSHQYHPGDPRLPSFHFPALPNRVAPHDSGIYPHESRVGYGYPDNSSPSLTTSVNCLTHPDIIDYVGHHPSSSGGQKREKKNVVVDVDPYAPIPISNSFKQVVDAHGTDTKCWGKEVHESSGEEDDFRQSFNAHSQGRSFNMGLKVEAFPSVGGHRNFCYNFLRYALLKEIFPLKYVFLSIGDVDGTLLWDAPVKKYTSIHPTPAMSADENSKCWWQVSWWRHDKTLSWNWCICTNENPYQQK